MNKPTTLNINHTIASVDDLVSATIDVFTSGLRGLAAAAGDPDLVAAIDKSSADDRIIKTLSCIIYQVCEADVNIAFELLNKVAGSVAKMDGADGVYQSTSINVVMLNEQNIGDFARAIGKAKQSGAERIDFVDSEGTTCDMPLEVAEQALTGANVERAKAGLDPVEPTAGTIH